MTEIIVAARAREVERSNLRLSLAVDIVQDGLLGKQYLELKEEAEKAGSPTYIFLHNTWAKNKGVIKISGRGNTSYFKDWYVEQKYSIDQNHAEWARTRKRCDDLPNQYRSYH